MSPTMPTCSSCGGGIRSVAEMEMAKALVGKVLCDPCLTEAMVARQQQLFYPPEMGQDPPALD